mmetsp:Transcript_51177/g.100263  ORF Transcript_51177/g.100263 Transcript_51177/m.100263 type:complete len:125 (+) Transcript_51177:274-648(+)
MSLVYTALSKAHWIESSVIRLSKLVAQESQVRATQKCFWAYSSLSGSTKSSSSRSLYCANSAAACSCRIRLTSSASSLSKSPSPGLNASRAAVPIRLSPSPMSDVSSKAQQDHPHKYVTTSSFF